MPTVVGTVRSRAFRVLWGLEELGVAYDFTPALPHSDEIRARNPSGKVPAYVEDDGTVITDSTAILTYLADKHQGLTCPAGTLARARQDSLTQLILDEFDGPLWVATKHSFGLPEELRLKEIKESCKWEFQRAADRLGERMDGEFLAGDQLTIPDILLCHCVGWSVVAKFGMENAKVQAHFDRMRARPAYQRARDQ